MEAVLKGNRAERSDLAAIRNQVLMLRANPAIKHNKEIAQILGVSQKTVSKHVNQAKRDLDAMRGKLGEYATAFKEGMNIAARAKRYEELAKQSSHPAVALQTLVRIDDLAGITTEKDRLRAINLDSGAVSKQPLFLMAPGSQVNFGSNTQSPLTASEAIEGEEVKPSQEPDR